MELENKLQSKPKPGSVGWTGDCWEYSCERWAKIIELCQAHQFLTLDFLREHIFVGLSDQRVRELLRKMERDGDIRRVFITELRSKAILLTNAGALQAKWTHLEMNYRQMINISTVAHDAKVADVAMFFRKSYPGQRWLPESFLKQEVSAGRVPDGMISIGEGEGDTLAVEVELTRKMAARYHNIFDSYQYREELTVLYLVPTEADRKHLLELFKRFRMFNNRRRDNLFVALLDDYKTHGMFRAESSSEKRTFPDAALKAQ